MSARGGRSPDRAVRGHRKMTGHGEQARPAAGATPEKREVRVDHMAKPPSSIETGRPAAVRRPFMTRCVAFGTSAALSLATAVTPTAVTGTVAGVAAFAATALVAAPAEARSKRIRIAAHENGSRNVKLGLDKSIVIDLPADAHDVMVASPEIADAIVRTARRIYVIGKQIGQTNIFVFGRNGEQVAAIDLDVERDISGLVSTIERLVPGSDIDAEMINDNIVLTGTVSTPQAAGKAVQLAEVFVSAGEQAQTGSGAGNALSSLFGDEQASKVINLLKITGDDQVHLKVTVAELSRSVIKQLGINSGVTRNYGLNGINADGKPGPLTPKNLAINGGTASDWNFGPAGPASGITGQVMRGAFNFNAELRALDQTGVMRTLAEPSLTAVSGEQAQFRVGGTFSHLKQATCEDGKKAFQYEEKEYGIAMAFTPVVLTSGRISLKIRTEVSEPTAQNAQTGLCGNLVGLRKRLADTTVELPSGGAMVIGGLVQDDVRQVVSGLPGAGKIPFFGALFRSREFVRDESEVVVIVTPYLVRPVAASKLRRPDDGFAPASDRAGNLLGRINRVYGVKKGKLPPGRYVGSVGFILE